MGSKEIQNFETKISERRLQTDNCHIHVLINKFGVKIILRYNFIHYHLVNIIITLYVKYK